MATVTHSHSHSHSHTSYRQADDPELDYAARELVAESVAHLVVSFVGLDTVASAVAYLASWAESAEATTFERIEELIDGLARRLEDALSADPGPDSNDDGPTAAAAPGHAAVAVPAS